MAGPCTTQFFYDEDAPKHTISGMSAKRLYKIEAYVQEQIEGGFAPMMSVSVVSKGKVVFQTFQGYADMERKVPLKSDTLIRIFSMTKPIASAAALTLVEEAKIDITDPIEKFIPSFKSMEVVKEKACSEDAIETEQANTPITVKHIMTHTSGITYAFLPDSPAVSAKYKELEVNFNPDIPGTNNVGADISTATMVERLAKAPLLCQPGTEWHYGNSTDVLGHLCEVVSGQNLEDFLQDRILKPLGMTDTSFNVAESEKQRLAALYVLSGQHSFTLMDDPATSALFTRPTDLFSGGGGLLSTADDYIKFLQFLLAQGRNSEGESVLGRKMVQLMMRNALPPDVEVPSLLHIRGGTGFGLGGSVVTNAALNGLPASDGTYGWGGAANTYFCVDPEEDVGFLLMTQICPSFELCRWRRELTNLVFAAIA
eukprot:m.761259 g.761259  ORF g.761259 m.761259 type:complete len:427 (+) comp23205_c1_seq7:157-1437(+)